MDIYKEEVMDHYEHPRNQGELSEASYEGKDANATCGDMVQFQLREKDGKVAEVGWKGIGCAITTASASKLSEWVVGKKLELLRRMSVEEMVAKGVGFRVSPGREKCLTLPVVVMKKAIAGS